ncbi:hypothetical protein N577_000190 [Lacticaseibacillus rhamnosus 2166]|nr:hypothetical protein N577_000190 [Lacticaseibacillus rhamnosus 2166]
MTAKKTGRQRQQAIAAYFNGIATGVGQVRQSINQVSAALTQLSAEVDQTLKPAMKDITASVETFEFETAPRTEASKNMWTISMMRSPDLKKINLRIRPNLNQNIENNYRCLYTSRDGFLKVM